MATDIGPKIGIQGEGEFRKQIKQINTSLKTMGAEMDMVTSAFIGQEKSEKALTAQNEILSSKMNELARKADLQKERLSELDKAGVDPTSASYQKLLQDLYKTEAQLNRTEAEIDQNKAALDGLNDEVDEASSKTSVFGDVLKAKLTGEAIVAGIKAIANAIMDISVNAAMAADDVATLAAQTGMTTDQIQEWKYMEELLDVSLDTTTSSMTKMIRTMSSAQQGSAKAQSAFASLGISITNVDGSLRDSQTVFYDVITALGHIENNTQRDAAAMEIFGKSAQELNPLIDAGVGTMRALAQEAHDVGYVIGEDGVRQLSAASNAYERMNKKIEAAKNRLAVELAPVMEKITDAIIYLIDNFDKFAPVLAAATAAVGGYVAAMTAMKIIDTITKLTKVFTVAQAALNAVLAANPVVLVVTALGALAAALAVAYATSEDFRRTINGVFRSIRDVVLDVVRFIASIPERMYNIGKDMVLGLWQGITAMARWIKEKIEQFFDWLFGGIKEFLGIHSPSTVYASIGEMMARGIGVGFTGAMRGVERDMMSSMPTPSLNVGTVTAGGAVAGGMGSGMVEEITIPVEVGGAELARVLYRHIVGEGQRIGAAAVR